MFWVRGMLEHGWEGTFFKGVLWDTATDVSTVGETRRGREGERRGASLQVEGTRVWDRDLDPVGGLHKLLTWGEGGPSDNRERATIHASRSLSDAALAWWSQPLLGNGRCVTNGTGSGLTGGGYGWGKAWEGLLVSSGVVLMIFPFRNGECALGSGGATV